MYFAYEDTHVRWSPGLCIANWVVFPQNACENLFLPASPDMTSFRGSFQWVKWLSGRAAGRARIQCIWCSHWKKQTGSGLSTSQERQPQDKLTPQNLEFRLRGRDWYYSSRCVALSDRSPSRRPHVDLMWKSVRQGSASGHSCSLKHLEGYCQKTGTKQWPLPLLEIVYCFA